MKIDKVTHCKDERTPIAFIRNDHLYMRFGSSGSNQANCVLRSNGSVGTNGTGTIEKIAQKWADTLIYPGDSVTITF